MSRVLELEPPVRGRGEIAKLCREMGTYDKHLACIYWYYQAKLYGYSTSARLRDVLLAAGEKPCAEGGWVPSGDGMRKRLYQAHELACTLRPAGGFSSIKYHAGAVLNLNNS